MIDIFPAWPLLATFIGASIVLALTPGPGVLYIVTRSLSQGRRAGLASVAGIALGNQVNAIAAALGLAALFAFSSAAFTVVKYAGAAYLIYLGIRMLRSTSTPDSDTMAPERSRHVFYDGFIVGLLNPKTTLFFAAFLPQFMSPDANPMVQGITLGTLFVVIASLTDAVYALAAGTLAPRLRRSDGARGVGRYLSAGTFIGLGLLTALAGPRSTD